MQWLTFMSLKEVGSLLASTPVVLALGWGVEQLWHNTPNLVCETLPIVSTTALPHFQFQPPWTIASRLTTPLSVPPITPSLLALEAYADRLTVQVREQEILIGSGTLLGRSPQGVGWILTNAHVVRGSTPPLQVRLSDRSVHSATWVKSYSFGGADLAVLQVANFPEAATVPPIIAALPNPAPPEYTVFAAGWTVGNDYYPSWQFAPGQFSYRLTQSLEGGYQFGYSNPIEKGMSGGPVLDAWGQLVGLNGQGKALWAMDNYYEDGTLPEPWMQELIDRFSWGIPSDRFASVWKEVNFSQDDRFFCTL